MLKNSVVATNLQLYFFFFFLEILKCLEMIDQDDDSVLKEGKGAEFLNL